MSNMSNMSNVSNISTVTDLVGGWFLVCGSGPIPSPRLAAVVVAVSG